jgi:hypothetical protein
MVLFAARSFSQDAHFSQFFEAPLLRNPSLAGIFAGDIRVQAVYRDQGNRFCNGWFAVAAGPRRNRFVGIVACAASTQLSQVTK